MPARRFARPCSLFRRVAAITMLILLTQAAGFAQHDPLHIWAGKLDRADAEKWVSDHLAREQKYIDEMVAVQGQRTVENTLRPFDNAQNELNVAGSQAYLMYAPAPQKDVRDAGQVLVQKVQEAASALALNSESGGLSRPRCRRCFGGRSSEPALYGADATRVSLGRR
jgi:thimet oligopeptidase